MSDFFHNNTIDELLARKSVRKFTDQVISAEQKAAIIACAESAPTAGNQQLYTIIDITDQALKEELVKTCDNQPFIATSSLVLLFCADCKKWYEGYQDENCNPRVPGVGDLLLAVADANIAAQNAVIAAWSMGIGSCYIGDVMENCEKQRELLHLPKYVFPAAMLVFGFPTEQQMNRPKPRRADADLIVSENKYPEYTKEDRARLFSTKSQDMQAFCNRKYNSDFSREMTRSVGIYLKDFKTDVGKQNRLLTLR